MIRLNLSSTTSFSAHRSGWSYCMSSLSKYHSRSGIFVNDFIEKDFGWNVDAYRSFFAPLLPYKMPWIGFLHNPPNCPDWFDSANSPQAILNRKVFQDSLITCKAIVCLSDYLADWLKCQVSVPVVSVKHPTETRVKKWDIKKYLKKTRKTLVQIGYWLRRFESIENIKCDKTYERVWLPGDLDYTKYMWNIYKKTTQNPKEDKFKFCGVQMKNVSNEEFDNLLSESVAFVDLYDSSANNAIVECIARNTPILVNRIPATEEYLGKDYPLFFKDVDHASEMLYDLDSIYRAHLYLKDMNKSWISGSWFANDLMSKLENVL